LPPAALGRFASSKCVISADREIIGFAARSQSAEKPAGKPAGKPVDQPDVRFAARRRVGQPSPERTMFSRAADPLCLRAIEAEAPIREQAMARGFGEPNIRARASNLGRFAIRGHP
jgi:hypothetical protein